MEPLYAIGLGCWYTLFCWRPSEVEPEELQESPEEDNVYTKLVDAV